MVKISIEHHHVGKNEMGERTAEAVVVVKDRIGRVLDSLHVVYTGKELKVY